MFFWSNSILQSAIQKIPHHDREYEKKNWPFITLAKQKHVGNQYENNHPDA